MPTPPKKTNALQLRTRQQQPHSEHNTENKPKNKDTRHNNSRRWDNDQAAIDAFLEAPLLLTLLLKEFFFRMSDPSLLFLLISLSFRRHPMVLPDHGSSASKLTRKSQSFLAKSAPGIDGKALDATTSSPTETTFLMG
jgi:hypothetical protein